MKWINLIGLCLQFLSFWLAAPELLGELTLDRLKTGLIKFVSVFPIYLFAFLGAGLGLVMGIMGTLKGINAKDGEPVDFIGYAITLGVVMLLYFVLLFFRIRIEKAIHKHFGAPFIESIIKNEAFRKKLLLAAAILFTLGFICQLIAAIAS
ncbi:MAG: hypothetical protein KDC83_08315 [Flavobacteriales bacterium]|nr:hypothetical protein [Flavobacteriales bacterium]